MTTIFEVIPEKNSIFIMAEYANGLSLFDYMMKRKMTVTSTFNEKDVEDTIRACAMTMNDLYKKLPFHGTLHFKNVYVHRGDIKLGELLFISDKTER